MAASSSDFDEAIAPLERDPAHKALVRDLRRAYRSLQTAKQYVEDDLRAETRDHAEAIQSNAEMAAELVRSKNAAEQYLAQVERSKNTIRLLVADVEKVQQEKQEAEGKVKPLDDELEKRTMELAERTVDLICEQERAVALEKELEDMRRRIQSQSSEEQQSSPHVGSEDIKMPGADATGEVKDEIKDEAQEHVTQLDMHGLPSSRSRPPTPPGEQTEESKPALSVDQNDLNRQAVGHAEAANDPLHSSTSSQGPIDNAVRDTQTDELQSANRITKRPMPTQSDGPSKRQKRSTHQEITTSSAAREDIRPKKLNIKNFVTGRASTIWDDKCKVKLPAFERHGKEYEMGDIVCVSDSLQHLAGYPVPKDSNAVVYSRIAVLCDYSATDPGIRGKITHPRRGSKTIIKHLAVMWLYRYWCELGQLFDGRVLHHSHVDLIDEERLRERFFGEDVSGSQCFVTTELEWIRLGKPEGMVTRKRKSPYYSGFMPRNYLRYLLLGHPAPSDIGTGAHSERSVIVDWNGPVLSVTKEIRPAPADSGFERQRWWKLELQESSGVGANELPNGWIAE